MRRKIAAANWKMNLRIEQGVQLLDNLLGRNLKLEDGQLVVFAVPFPYLAMAMEKVKNHKNFVVAAQNCHQKLSGAYTGEISADMLQSLGVPFVVLGHSERREYNGETNALLAEKINTALSIGLQPIFCCGEPLQIREEGTQNSYVEKQLQESLFHLTEDQLKQIVIAYEPIWAIGTGKTATAEQAQEMHLHLRNVLQGKFGKAVSDEISILYGGSVKGSNAKELFSKPDVDGGLVGGASLMADDFTLIMEAIK
jgi:triosephosphate isomerase (TIM)